VPLLLSTRSRDGGGDADDSAADNRCLDGDARGDAYVDGGASRAFLPDVRTLTNE
jgi:hypothetical protein